jgi:predicted RNA-binding Zn ribbon-like protein
LLFAPDTEDALEFAVALVNTAPGASKSGADEIATPAELTALLDAHGYSGRFDRDVRELREVQQTRERLRAVWGMSTDQFVVDVNETLRAAKALPFLSKHDHFDWHWHATEPDAPLAVRIRVEVALAFADVIRSAATDRMRECAADDCTGVLIDFSRNGSKRFCSVRCGNRMNMIAFRERRAD